MNGRVFVVALLATVKREFLLLRRDRAGLLVLFLMPAVLVTVITLVQQNIMQKMGTGSSRILVINHDGEDLSEKFICRFSTDERFEIVRVAGENEAAAAVTAGEAELYISIPAGLSQEIRRRAASEVQERLLGGKGGGGDGSAGQGIEIYFDPTVLGGFRSAMLISMDAALMSLQFDEVLSVLRSKLGGMTGVRSESFSSPLEEAGEPCESAIRGQGRLNEWGLAVREVAPRYEERMIIPNAVQQNVPAWSLFGIFFIVVPLSGSLIKERFSGVLGRLLVMPAPFAVTLLGKTVVYTLVCLIQFSVILGIGKYLLPLLGTPAFDLGAHYGAAITVICAVVSAAVAYGILIGVVTRTYDQASMFGAISVVIAAAIGGVMVPVHAMPEPMRMLSGLSPIGWALRALLQIFVRNGALADVLADVALLLAFAFVAILTAWLVFSHREKRGTF